MSQQSLFVMPQMIFQGLPLHFLNLLTRTEDHRVKDHRVSDHYHILQAHHHQLSILVTHCVILWRSRIDCWGALPTFDRADKKANNEPLNFDS